MMVGSDPNVCSLAATDDGVVGAFVSRRPENHKVNWLALCDDFYTYPETVSPNIPEDADNLNRYKSQASQLLHEREYGSGIHFATSADMSTVTHFRFPNGKPNLPSPLNHHLIITDTLRRDYRRQYSTERHGEN